MDFQTVQSGFRESSQSGSDRALTNILLLSHMLKKMLAEKKFSDHEEEITTFHLNLLKVLNSFWNEI